MFTRTLKAVAVTLILMVTGGVGKAPGQKAPSAKAAPETDRVTHSYRLDFSVSEVEDGKKINSRQYSLNLNAGDANEVKIGTRVPFEQAQGQYTYIDVGTNIWCRLRDHADITSLSNEVALNVRSEISNFAVPEQQGQSVRPMLRQLKIDASTVAVPGKPVVVGSVDDPGSKRQFQLEVTVTKLR
jgi:hypothetical protein